MEMNPFDEIRINPDAAPILGIESDSLPRFFYSCLEAHSSALAQRGQGIRKDSPESAVTIVSLPGRPGVCVKEFRWRGWFHGLKGLFRRTQGLRAFINGVRLKEEGIGTALPLALVRNRRFGLVGSEWVVMELVPNALELDRYLLTRMAAAWTPEEKRSMARMFGRFIGLMHSSGIFHSDLKTCNILVSESRMPAVGHAEKSWDRPLSFSLLDYDHVAFRRQLIQKKRVKNLVQIFLSTPLAVRASDRLRFMREYSLHAGIDHRDRRRMEREVLEAASGHRILYVGFQGDISELWD